MVSLESKREITAISKELFSSYNLRINIRKLEYTSSNWRNTTF